MDDYTIFNINHIITEQRYDNMLLPIIEVIQLIIEIIKHTWSVGINSTSMCEVFEKLLPICTCLYTVLTIQFNKNK